jgi:predicted NBD/HSP70 family sugar kinase
MEFAGLDVRSGGVFGVVVDIDGRVLRRARADGEPGSTLAFVWRELSRARTFEAAGISSDTDLGELGIKESGISHSRRFFRCSPGSAAVAAEAWVGAARDAEHAICLWVGDRVFCGTLLNGQPWMGAHGLAGAAAWLALNPVERQDYRKYGSLGAEISDKGIARRLAWRIQAGDHSAVLERAGDLEAITAEHVLEGARAGDGVAISVVRDTARYIGMAVSNLVAAIDPEVVVLGGPLSTAGDLLLEPVKHECVRRLPPEMAAHLRFEMSPLADDGVAIGAASLAFAARQP